MNAITIPLDAELTALVDNIRKIESHPEITETQRNILLQINMEIAGLKRLAAINKAKALHRHQKQLNIKPLYNKG